MDPASGDVAFLVYDRVVYAPPPPYSHVYDANGKLRISGVLPPDVLAMVAGAESNESYRAGPAGDLVPNADPDTVKLFPVATVPDTPVTDGAAPTNSGKSAKSAKIKHLTFDIKLRYSISRVAARTRDGRGSGVVVRFVPKLPGRGRGVYLAIPVAHDTDPISGARHDGR